MHAATPVYFVLRRYWGHMLDKYVNKLKLKIIRYVIKWNTENLDIKIITNETLFMRIYAIITSIKYSWCFSVQRLQSKHGMLICKDF